MLQAPPSPVPPGRTIRSTPPRRQLARPAVLALALPLLAGCGPKVKLLKQDESFNYDALRPRKIAIVGATSLMGHEDDPDFSPERWSASFERELRAEREELDVVPILQVKESFGEEE